MAQDTLNPKEKAAAAEVAKKWQSRIEACRKARKTLKPTWDENINYRTQKPYDAEAEEHRASVPQDWSRTRAKEAQLFSAVPSVTLTALDKRTAPAVPIFQKEFNHVLTHQAKPAVMMSECLPDLINAAGFCAGIARYEATFEQKEVPAVDLSMLLPEQTAMLLQSGQVPMETVPVPVSQRFTMRRISPSQLVWDVRYKGADWNEARFIGHDGSLPWPVAKREFRLSDADQTAVLGGEKQELLGDADDHESGEEEREVSFTEIFYRAAMFDADELHLDKIKRIVFVEGISDRPVIDEDYQGQKYDEQSGEYVGVCIFPIQVCTLTYISDQLIPPSDSEIGRPMVQEQMQSRTDMMLQRKHSIPTRWHNTNRIDPSISALLERGEYQGSIPVNGDGSTAIGEVARVALPPQNFQIDAVFNRDLDNAWAQSDNQMGAFQSGERSAREAGIVAQANQTITGRERAQVVRFFLNLCEVLGGLMQLYHEPKDVEEIVGPDGVQRLESWDRNKIAGKYVFTIRQDSSVLLDSNQRLERLLRFINLCAQSGYVNVEPIISEIAALSGLDPAEVMRKPNEPKPETPNISMRFTGIEDLKNPIVLAMLLKNGQAPSPQDLQAAQAMLQAAMQPPLPQVTSGPVPQGALPPGPPDMPPAAPGPNPNWTAMPRISKRADENELGG